MEIIAVFLITVFLAIIICLLEADDGGYSSMRRERECARSTVYALSKKRNLTPRESGRLARSQAILNKRRY